MSSPDHSRNRRFELMLCVVVNVVLHGSGAFAASEHPGAVAVVNRIASGKEPIRRAAIPLVEWNQGHDEEYRTALHELIAATVRRPVLDSTFTAVQKLADCPLPAASASVAQALQASDWRLAMVAVEVLGHRRADDTAAAIRKVWDRPEAKRFYALRHTVVCSLGDIGGPTAVEGLVGLLPDLDGQLKYEAVARLTLRTGENHGSDVTAWKEWWTAQDGVVPDVPVAANEELPVDLPWQRALPRFFNLPIYSQRVVFVLDHSKSMLSTLEGKPRLEAMQDEFTKVMQRLPEAAAFGMVVFNERVDVWKSALTPANSSSKSAAIQSIYSLQATGKTAVYDALEAAIQLDQNIEQIVFLTDGRPTAGKITNDAEIVNAITLLNRYHHIRIDCLGIDTEGPPEELLKQISQRNSGTYTRIR